ncbi:MAG: SRPBCC family protein [Steroidobacteraceae bacterium]
MAAAAAQVHSGSRSRTAGSPLQRALDGLDHHTAVRALGWFSVGLGVAELVAARSVGRAIGMQRPWTLRALGVRELVSGVGILTRPRRSAWLWSRVAGDAMDLGLLGAAFGRRTAHRGRLVAAAGAVGLVTALDVQCSLRMSRSTPRSNGSVQLDASVLIDRSADELYRFWRDSDNLLRFMRHVREVRTIDAERSHWVADGPMGSSVEWDSLITDDRPGELIAWRSAPESPLQTSGSVRFGEAPNAEGSLVRLQLRYEPAPGAVGAAGAAVARIVGAISRQQLKGELRRFKQLIETGEITTTAGQPSGRRTAKASLANRVLQS